MASEKKKEADGCRPRASIAGPSARPVVHRVPTRERRGKSARSRCGSDHCPHLWRLVWSLEKSLQTRHFYREGRGRKSSLSGPGDAAMLATPRGRVGRRNGGRGAANRADGGGSLERRF